MRSGRFNRISVPSPKFNKMFHEAKSQSSPTSHGLSLLEEEDENAEDALPLNLNDLKENEKTSPPI